MRRLIRLLFNALVVAAVALSTIRPVRAQEGSEDAFIANLLPRLTPEVKIGQLFAVAFNGTDVSGASDIADLVANYHVGGVVLSDRNGNLIDAGSRTPSQIAGLTSALQRQVAQPPADSLPFIPLFVMLAQDGGGPAYSSITSGLTPQPSPMSIGATWSPADAQAIGRIVGSELSAIGINFLIGPSLDVLTQPDPDGGDAGVRALAGDPYWVGALADAYVMGLREGSGGRMATAAKTFPGEGGRHADSDTIDASLNQLQRVDLAPYFALMTVPAGQPRPVADAVLTSHARYRGFENLRDVTDPTSVDAAALGTLLELPQVAAWRNQGGLVVSGPLGDETLRRFYDPTGATFPIEQIALDAFLAGNDVLLLDGFAPNQPPAVQAAAVKSVMRAFLQRYREDLNFQARVDSAVTRILRLKYRLYPEFRLADALATTDGLDSRLRQGGPAVERVAQHALTQVYPPVEAAAEAPVPIPGPDDEFLVFTDDRLITACADCPPRTTLFTRAISQALTSVAGVPSEQIASYGFADLKAYVTGAPNAPDLSDDFARATWVLLAQQDIRDDVEQSDAARLLLRNRPDLIAGKRAVQFSFGPPYLVSEADHGRLTAHYALYSFEPPFIEMAVRALFGQAQPVGSPPVAVEAAGYDLLTQLEPDPDQVIELLVGGAAPGPGTPTPPPPSFRVGDDLHVRTGIIYDRNGNPVPDGTPVRFTLVYRDAGDKTTRVDSSTVGGAAEVITPIENEGRLAIRAVSEPAVNSVGLQLTIAEGEVTIVETLAPPPTPTPTSPPTVTPTPAPTATPTATPIPLLDSLTGAEPRRAYLSDFALAVLGVTLVGAWGYRVESRRREEDAVDRAVRLALWSSLCGLIAYAGYALGLPGADAVHAVLGGWSALVVTLVGAAIPWMVDGARRRTGRR